MKLSCLQENLSKGLSIVTRVVSSTGSLPVLANVLLKASEGRLKLQATDLETGVTAWVGAQVKEEGSITIPAKVFSRLVSELSPGEIFLETEKQTLYLSAQNVESEFNGLSAGEFPELPKFSEKGSFGLRSQDLKVGLEEVIFATAQDEGRPTLTGVLFVGEGEVLTLVGVDGFRLAEKRLDFGEVLPDLNFVVPARTLRELALLLGKEDAEEVRVFQACDENQILFKVGDICFSSRLLEGNFPEYKGIIPANATTRIELPRKEFLKAVRLASLFTGNEANVVRLEISPAEGLVSVSANAQEIGKNKVEVEVKGDGDGGEIAFNAKYLTDCLSVLSSEQVVFEMGGGLEPGVIRPQGSDDYLHVIMPVRVQRE